METPSTKVTTFAVAAAVAAVLAWLVSTVAHVEMPGEVETAIAIIVGFLLAYWVPETNPPSSARERQP